MLPDERDDIFGCVCDLYVEISLAVFMEFEHEAAIYDNFILRQVKTWLLNTLYNILSDESFIPAGI